MHRASHRQGISEYFIGGRKMNRFVVALSAVVSGRSAWLLLGVTGMAYAQGPSAIWAVLGIYRRRNLSCSSTTDAASETSRRRETASPSPTFFAERFSDHDGKLRMTIVTIFLIFMIGYVASQFVAGGKAFASGFRTLKTHTGIFCSQPA
jgi:Na+/proline symporter